MASIIKTYPLSHIEYRVRMMYKLGTRFVISNTGTFTHLTNNIKTNDYMTICNPNISFVTGNKDEPDLFADQIPIIILKHTSGKILSVPINKIFHSIHIVVTLHCLFGRIGINIDAINAKLSK